MNKDELESSATGTEEIIRKIIDDETMDNFRELSTELGLSPEQSQGVFFWILDGAVALFNDLDDVSDAGYEASEYELRKMFGANFEQKQRAALRIIQQFGGEEMVAWLRKTGMHNCKEFVIFMMKLAEAAMEDEGLVGEKSPDFTSEDKMKAQIAKLMAHPAYMQAQHPEHDSTVQKVYQLRKQLLNEE